MEELKQLVTATAKKIEIYDGHAKQYRENTQSQNNQRLFYKSLGDFMLLLFHVMLFNFVSIYCIVLL